MYGSGHLNRATTLSFLLVSKSLPKARYEALALPGPPNRRSLCERSGLGGVRRNTSPVARQAKASLLFMAGAWNNLADRADRNNTVDLVYETPP